MAADMFLIFESGIEGETLDARYADEHAIDVLAWSWGMRRVDVGPEGAEGTGRRRSRASFQDLSVTKYLDSSSTQLMEFCALGKRVPSARLIVRTAGRAPVEALVIGMSDVFVAGLSTGGSGGEDRLTENVVLGFGQVTVTYTGQRPDGASGARNEFGWDLLGERRI